MTTTETTVTSLTPTVDVPSGRGYVFAGGRFGIAMANVAANTPGLFLTTVDDGDRRIEGLSTSVGAAAADAASINLQLAGGGYVSIIEPGTYLVNDTLVIPSNTHLHLGVGVTIKLANNTNKALLRNSGAYNTSPTVLVNEIKWQTGSPLFRARIRQAGISTTYPVNSWIAVTPITPTSGATTAFTAGFPGVWQVKASGNDGLDYIEYDMMGAPPSGGHSAVGAWVFPVDTNITVSGPGTLDGNADNQDTIYVASHPFTNLTWFRNVRNVCIRNITTKRAKSWGFAFNSCADVHVHDVEADNYGTGAVDANDTVHFTGGTQRVIAENIFSSCNDNTVGLTGDDTVIFPYWTPGPSDSVIFRNIWNYAASSAAIVGIWGSSKYPHRSVTVDGVFGKGGSGVGGGNYAPTAMTSCTGGVINISRVHAACQGQSVGFLSSGTWDNIIIDDVYNESPNGDGTYLIDFGVTQTIGNLSVSNVASSRVGSRTQQLVNFTDATVASANFTALNNVRTAANQPVIKYGGSTTVAKTVIDGCSTSAQAAGTNSLLQVASSAAQGEVNFINSTFTGSGGNGTMLNVSGAGVVASLSITTSSIATAAGWISASSLGRLNGSSAQFNGSNITTPISGDLFYNTNAGFGAGVGVYVRGASTWTRVAA